MIPARAAMPEIGSKPCLVETGSSIFENSIALGLIEIPARNELQ
jgi:hypothetical protein